MLRRWRALVRVGRLVSFYAERPSNDHYAAEIVSLGFQAMEDLIYGSDPLVLAVAMSRRVRMPEGGTSCRYGAGSLSAARQRVVMTLSGPSWPPMEAYRAAR